MADPKLDWIPWLFRRWLSSATIAAMEPELECAYFRLLLYQCQSEDGMLATDRKALSRLAKGLSGDALEEVLKNFKEKDGRLYNSVMYEQWEKAKSICDRKRSAARKAAKTRWHTDSKGNADASPDASQTHSVENASAIHSNSNNNSLQEHEQSQESPPNPPTGESAKPKKPRRKKAKDATPEEFETVEEMIRQWNGTMPDGVSKAEPVTSAPEQAKVMISRIRSNPWVSERWQDILYGCIVKYRDLIEQRRVKFLQFGWLCGVGLARLESLANLGAAEGPKEESSQDTWMPSDIDEEAKGRAIVVWGEVMSRITRLVPADEFETWFSEITPVAIVDNRLYLHPSNETVQEWVSEAYFKHIKAILVEIGYPDLEAHWGHKLV